MAAKSILLIEPDEAERQELAEVLGRLGYRVEAVSGSQEGLRLFGQNNHDLVIVEVLLPGINGLQVSKIAKEQGESWGVRVIIVSKIYQSRAMERDALTRFKADAYFSRPFPLINLVEKINQLIGVPETRAPLRPRAAAPKPETKEPPAAAPEPAPPAPPAEKPVAAAKAEKPSQAPPAEKPAAAAKTEKTPPAPPVAAAPSREEPPLGEQGEFEPRLLGRLLAKLGRERFGGLLELKHGDELKHVYFVEGKIVFVQSTLPDEHLGRMLLADGVLTEEQYKNAAVQMAESGRKFGTIITQMGVLSSEDLYYHLVQQTRRKIARCFAWPAGHFILHRDKKYPAEATTFECETFAAVLDGYRQHLAAAPLEADYAANKDLHLFLGEAREVAAARVHLTPDERELLAAADGRRTLGEAAGESPLGLMAALRLTGALVCLDVVRLAAVETHPDLESYRTQVPPTADEPEADPRFREQCRELKSFFVRMDDLNYFDLLGVKLDVEPEALHQAYVQLERKFHPDVFTLKAPQRVRNMAETVSRRLKDAYDTLKDPRARRNYARKLGLDAAPKPEAKAGAGEPPEEADKEKQAALAYQEGLMAMEKQSYWPAIESFRRAAELLPKKSEYRAKLAWAMFKFLDAPNLNWEDVEQAAKQALLLDTENAELMSLLGRVKNRQDDDEGALRYFKNALALDPHNTEYKRDLHYTEQRLKKEKDDKTRSVFRKRP
ncbi:MAG: response regulator [Myxococcales bacterium]|nr:response regulator [Myxococcales bacterium]